MIRHAFAVLFLFAASLAAQAGELISPADERAIREIAVQGDVAWNARDAGALAATFSADGRNVILNTPVDLRGREAIAAYFASSLPKVPADLRHRTRVEELTPVTSDVVVASIQVWLERVGPDGARTPVKRFSGTAVVVREGDAWRIRVNRVHPETNV
jgi:uncharacterized protein (TIGR02246 family)